MKFADVTVKYEIPENVEYNSQEFIEWIEFNTGAQNSLSKGNRYFNYEPVAHYASIDRLWDEGKLL